MAVEITFIRHGQTEGNAAGRWQGHTNSSLTARGREQASLLARKLNSKHFDLVVASDLDRTVQTAEALERPFETDERWREPDFGKWEDRTTEEIAADGSGELAALMAGEDIALGGGERLSQVMLRTRFALDELVARLDGVGSAAVVSHGMSLLTLFSGVLGTKRPSPLRLLGNTSTGVLVVSGDHVSMSQYNDDTHLPADHRSQWVFDPTDTQMIVARHGQTRSNTEGRWQGHQDGMLNDVGREQAELLAGVFPDVDALYASPLARAADTAGAIARTQELDVAYDDRLKEIHFGDWEGLTSDEIAERFPEEAVAFFNGKDMARGGSGETFIQVRKRLRDSLDEIVSRHSGETIGVVSHGGATRAWVTELLGLGYEHRNRLSILDNTGYARISFGSRGPSVASWNLTPHLEGV
ncbi:MAG: histidine phosphatase family protein [Acidimicrobiia bacterium]|nr:histidine phosphatase family protein [Acidimicrobiia bacterium]